MWARGASPLRWADDISHYNVIVVFAVLVCFYAAYKMLDINGDLVYNDMVEEMSLILLRGAFDTFSMSYFIVPH